jgi:hypothetical protein
MHSDSFSFHFQFLLMFLISLTYGFYYNTHVCTVLMSSFPVTSTSCLLQHPLAIGTFPCINKGARVHKYIISSTVIRIFVIVTNNRQPAINFNFRAVSSRFDLHFLPLSPSRLSQRGSTITTLRNIKVLSRLYET